MINTQEDARTFVASLGKKDAEFVLEQFVCNLIAENAKQNLISRHSINDVWVRHIADSAQLLLHVPRETSGIWLDLGTGAGFPGVVIAILRPDLEVQLVEARALRVEWLKTQIDQLSLKNCTIIHADVETLSKFPSAVVSARAFAPLARLIAIAERFSTAHTRWVLPKGRSAAQELSTLPTHLRAMFHVEPSRTSYDAGIIVGQGRPELEP